MYFAFKFLLKRTVAQIKAGKEFVIRDNRFISGKISIKAIPKDWEVQIVDDLIYIGKEDKFVSNKDIYVMLMLAENFQSRIRAIPFIQGLGLHT